VEHTYLIIVTAVLLLGVGTSGIGAVLAMDSAWVRRHADHPRVGRVHP